MFNRVERFEFCADICGPFFVHLHACVGVVLEGELGDGHEGGYVRLGEGFDFVGHVE